MDWDSPWVWFLTHGIFGLALTMAVHFCVFYTGQWRWAKNL